MRVGRFASKTPSDSPDDSGRGHTRMLVVVAFAAMTLGAFLLRVRFTAAGIGMDEGGYLYVAWRWSHGAQLYTQAWIDRPQGLILVYRFALMIADATWPVRLLAALFGAAETLVIGLLVRRLHGDRAGILAAFVYAVVGASLTIQGYTLNGELAAVLPATVAVLLVVWWRTGSGRDWLLVLAGASAASAVLMKQSGFDGLVVCLVVVAAAALRGRTWRPWVLFGAGVCVPFAAAAADAALIGAGEYWTAVAGWRLSAASGGGASFAQRLTNLDASWQIVKPDLTRTLLAALAGAAVVLYRGPRLLCGWALAAFACLNIGALYWPHYWVQMAPPLAALAGVALAKLRYGVLQLAVALVVVAPPAGALLQLVTESGPAFRAQPTYGALSLTDERVAAFIDRHSRPTDLVYVLVSRPDVYFYAHRVASYPYLWQGDLVGITGSLDLLRASFVGRAPPKLVAVYQQPDAVDPSGQLERVIAAHYRFLACVAHTTIGVLERTPSATGAQAITMQCNKPRRQPRTPPRRNRPGVLRPGIPA
jgi:hypothetical protein